jgi:hypothetical protein
MYCILLEVLNEPVDNENDGPAARLEQTNHPVVGFRSQLVDL